MAKKAPQPLNEVDREWNQENAEIMQGMFGFTVDQQAIPSLTMVQPVSAEIPDYRKHIGEIYNTVTGEFFDSVEIIVIGWNTPRAVFPYPYNRSLPQLCSSIDSFQPYQKYIGSEITAKSKYGEMNLIVPETCEDCPLYDNPLCTKMFRYFGITPHDNLIFTMRWKKSAMDAAKKLNFWLGQHAKQGTFKSFIISTSEVSGSEGTYFVPTVEVGNDATEMLRKAYEMNRLLEGRIRSISEQPLLEAE